jgi:hypothetical protein
MGIVVPAAAPQDLKKDSVELLLDGITGPQPERMRTKPQTDGEASAAYHARHDVRAARTSPDEEPKVVIERITQPPTIRIDRSKLPLFDEASARAALEPTAVVPPKMGPRIVLAVVAGLLVVFVLLVAVRVASKSPWFRGFRGAASASSAPAAVTTAEPRTIPPPPPVMGTAAAKQDEAEPAVGAPSPAAPVIPSAAEEAPAAVEGAGAGPAPHPRSPAAPSSSAAKPRSKAAASAASPKELGELKTNFH